MYGVEDGVYHSMPAESYEAAIISWKILPSHRYRAAFFSRKLQSVAAAGDTDSDLGL